MAIFWYAPPLLNKMYLIIISTLMAIFFTRLPEWTTWMILLTVAIYDLFAVLCPGGPLKLLVELAQVRIIRTNTEKKNKQKTKIQSKTN